MDEETSKETNVSSAGVAKCNNFPFSDVKSSYSNSPSVTSESGEMLAASTSSSAAAAPRRRSTRDIKRPKFADEIMDGGSSTTAAAAGTTGSTRKTRAGSPAVSTDGDIKQIKQEPGRRDTASPTLSQIKREERGMKRELDASEKAVAAVTSAIGDARKASAAQPQQKKSRPSRSSSVADAGNASAAANTAASNSTSVAHNSPRHTSAKNPGKNMRNAHDAAAGAIGQSHSAALEDANKWSATDDLMLVTAVLQVNDLRKVFTGIKFSHRFTLSELEQRWYALLYDPTVSRAAKDAMKALPAETVLNIQSTTLFTAKEEQILAALPSTSQLTLSDMEQVLQRNALQFHEARTARALHDHWQLMKNYKLLNDQRTLPWTAQPNEMSFSEIEDSLDAEPSGSMPVDPLIESELYMAERRLNREVRLIENELPKWQVLTEAVTGINPPDFDAQTMAVLRGRLVRYLIRSKDVLIGRNAHNHTVDVDLSLEGPSYKISRRQGCIKMRPTGEFFITNDGKRPIYVDGQPILHDCKAKLSNNSVIEIGSVRLCFLENQEIMNKIRMEAAKLMVV